MEQGQELPILDCGCHTEQRIANDPQLLFFCPLHEAAPDLLVALDSLLNRYVQLVNCGDCGNWDPEQEEDVKAARFAIGKATDDA